MPIDPLPTPPSRDDAADFATRADAFLGAFPVFAVQANALEANVNLQAANTANKVDTFTALLASTGLTQFGDPPNILFVTRNSDSGNAPGIHIRRSRGSASAPTNLGSGDRVGDIYFDGQIGGGLAAVALIRVNYIDTGAGYAGRFTFFSPVQGGTGSQEIMRLEADTGLTMFGGNPVIDQNQLLRLRSYTVGTLPAASLSPLGLAWASDIGGTSNGIGLVLSDGSRWTRLGRNFSASATYDKDANVTLPPNYLLCPTTILCNSTLSGNRTMTLPTSGAGVGDRLRVTRTGGGGFLLNIGGLKPLATNTWCDVEWTGAAWVLTAYGSL